MANGSNTYVLQKQYVSNGEEAKQMCEKTWFTIMLLEKGELEKSCFFMPQDLLWVLIHLLTLTPVVFSLCGLSADRYHTKEQC